MFWVRKTSPLKLLETHSLVLLQDLYARETMRVILYRYIDRLDADLEELRLRKAHHRDFLLALLRKRGLKPAWYTFLFSFAGHCFGWIVALLPEKWAKSIEYLLEHWLYLRYEDYLKKLKQLQIIKPMLEALQNQNIEAKLLEDEVLSHLDSLRSEQAQWIKRG